METGATYAGSISSISTRSSRASEGFDSDVERGEKTATRVSHRTDQSVVTGDGGRSAAPWRTRQTQKGIQREAHTNDEYWYSASI